MKIQDVLMWGLVACLLFGFFQAPKSRQKVLELKSVSINKDYPVQLLLGFNPGDEITLECVEGNATKKVTKINDLNISIVSLTSNRSQDVSIGSPITLSEGGKYRLELKTTGKNISLSYIKILRYGVESPQDVVRIERLFSGSNDAEQPRLVFDMVKGDKVDIKGKNASLEIVEEGDKVPATKDKPDITYSLSYAEEKPTVRTIIIKPIFDKKFLMFGKELIPLNLEFTVAKKAATGSGSSGSGADGAVGAGAKGGGGADPAAAQAELIKAMSEGNKELAQAFMDMMKQDSTMAVVPVQVNVVPTVVNSAKDLRGTNCACQTLAVQPAEIFVWWMGVGDKAMNSFKTAQTKRTSGNILADYAQALIEGQPADDIFKFNQSDVFTASSGQTTDAGEDTRFAIFTTKPEAEAFVQGSYINYPKVTAAHNQMSGTTLKELYVCYQNDNAVSSIRPWFVYELFNKNKVVK